MLGAAPPFGANDGDDDRRLELRGEAADGAPVVVWVEALAGELGGTALAHQYEAASSALADGSLVGAASAGHVVIALHEFRTDQHPADRSRLIANEVARFARDVLGCRVPTADDAPWCVEVTPSGLTARLYLAHVVSDLRAEELAVTPAALGVEGPEVTGFARASWPGPRTWGLRGDPHLWESLRRRFARSTRGYGPAGPSTRSWTSKPPCARGDDPRYDIGDRIHLNPIGYRRLAEAVDLAEVAPMPGSGAAPAPCATRSVRLRIVRGLRRATATAGGRRLRIVRRTGTSVTARVRPLPSARRLVRMRGLGPGGRRYVRTVRIAPCDPTWPGRARALTARSPV